VTTLQIAYQEYVENVSEAVWAISLELAEQLVRLCDERQPKRILDLGSGFSSYVLGKWAKEHGAECWSVDDKKDWLEKTQDFVYGHDAAANNHGWELWEQFYNPRPGRTDRGKFDFVCYDMGTLHTRMRVIRPVMFHVAPGGLLVMDDLNFTEYHRAVEWLLNRWGFTKESLKEQTLDQFGRYAWMAEAPDKWPEYKREARVLLGIPRERMMMVEAFDALWDIARDVQLPLQPGGYTRTDIQRNLYALRLLYNPEFTHLLMLDMDHKHPLETPRRLVNHWLHDPGKLVISYLYHRRGEPYDPMAYKRDEETGELYALPKWEPGLHKVASVGAGGLLIAREVFEIIPPLWFQYNYEGAEDTFFFPSEDIDFCAKCAKYGVEIWLDSTVEGIHLTTQQITHETFERHIAEHPELVNEEGILNLDLGLKMKRENDEDQDA